MEDRRRKVRLIILATALIAFSASAALPERAHEVTDHVAVIIKWVGSQQELREIAAQVGKELERGRVHGFSVLAQHEQGPWICMVYAFKPVNWNDTDRLATLGHELLHCRGYEHD